ncbi:MAG: hypothetical protein AAB649_06665 [Patescibacteria group bacterium]
MEDLKKRKRQYGWGAVILAFAVYGIGQMGNLIISQGGTDHVSATILVWLNAVFSFGVLFCVVMWFSDLRKIRKMSEPREEQRNSRNIKEILITIAAIIVMVAGLVSIFDKIEIHPTSLWTTKQDCVEKLAQRYSEEYKPTDRLGNYVATDRLKLADPGIVFLSGMTNLELVQLALKEPGTQVSSIIRFPIDTKDPALIERLTKSRTSCDKLPPFICYKNSSCP